MDELLAQFLIEGPELVQQASDALFALERNPADVRPLDQAFRAFHTLKGSVGLFELPALEALLHSAEDTLGALRSNQRPVERNTLDHLFSALSQTERWLTALATGSALPSDTEDGAAPLIDTLSGEAGSVAIRYRPDARSYFNGDDPMRIMRGVPGLMEMRIGVPPADLSDAPYDPFTCTLTIDAVSSAELDAVKTAFRFVSNQVELTPLAPSAEAALPTDITLRTLRVEIEKIEGLAALVDELVTAKNALSDQLDPGRFGSLDRLVARVHQSVTGLRMVPVSPFLRRFPRLVREMAASLGREVELIVEDGAVEADKDVIERLFEPLTHLLRNAVDHGVEPAELRSAAGKPARAAIRLTAETAGSRLLIHLIDDGRGIDPAHIRTLAAQRGLLAPEQLNDLSDQEAIELIFLPGFSTAKEVSALSGRGVGMDAVRTAVHRLGGAIALSSRLGAGTDITLSLPLSISLTKIVVVTDGDQHYGLPLDRVLETVRLPAGAAAPIRAGHAFNWRDRTLPLLALSALTGRSDAPLSAIERKVMVVRAHGQPVGLAIDGIVGRLDVAMRPPEGLLAAMPGLAGTTLLGNGQVLIILDPEALVA